MHKTPNPVLFPTPKYRIKRDAKGKTEKVPKAKQKIAKPKADLSISNWVFTVGI